MWLFPTTGMDYITKSRLCVFYNPSVIYSIRAERSEDKAHPAIRKAMGRWIDRQNLKMELQIHFQIHGMLGAGSGRNDFPAGHTFPPAWISPRDPDKIYWYACPGLNRQQKTPLKKFLAYPSFRPGTPKNAARTNSVPLNWPVYLENCNGKRDYQVNQRLGTAG